MYMHKYTYIYIYIYVCVSIKYVYTKETRKLYVYKSIYEYIYICVCAYIWIQETSCGNSIAKTGAVEGIKMSKWPMSLVPVISFAQEKNKWACTCSSSKRGFPKSMSWGKSGNAWRIFSCTSPLIVHLTLMSSAAQIHSKSWMWMAGSDRTLSTMGRHAGHCVQATSPQKPVWMPKRLRNRWLVGCLAVKSK